MKKLISVSSFLVFASLLFLQTGVTSCTKEKIVVDTVTVTKTDTLIIQDTTVSLELLTANSWKLQEIRGVNGNTMVFYERGGTLNTQNFDNEYIRFRADGTGTYFDASGATHQITWEFSNEARTKLTFVVSNPAPLESHIVVYENLRYKNQALLFDQYWTYDNINSHAQVIRIPGNK
jgi:hypothetical protein